MNRFIFFHFRVFLVSLLVTIILFDGRAQQNQDSLSINELSFFDDLVFEEKTIHQKDQDSLRALLVPLVDLETVEDRVSCLPLDMPIVINKTVCSFIQFFTVRKRNYTQTMLERKNYYFPIFEYYLQKHQMPDALKYLAIVESGLNFKARSRTGAVGLWQFMPGTGKDFYLSQTQHLDERQNPYLATEAACKFLKYLHGMFNDWELALAAYNCGPGNVMKAMRKSGKRGFWEIYNFLPQETRSYVPQFHAVVYSMNFAAEHNIFPDFDSTWTTVSLDTFRVKKTFDLVKLERILGLPSNCLHKHNPTLKSDVFPSDSKHPLLIPQSHSILLASEFDRFLDSASVEETSLNRNHKADFRFRRVTVFKGQKIRDIARKYDIEPELLCSLNGLQGRSIGRKRLIRIPFEPDILVSQKSQSPTLLKPLEIKSQKTEDMIPGESLGEGIHKVGEGEKLYQIAIRYGVKTRDLKKWNHLPSSKIKEGQKLIVKENVSLECQKSEELANAIIINKVQQKETHNEKENRFYTVLKGDVLFSISKQLGYSVKDLRAWNPGLKTQVFEGQILKLWSENEGQESLEKISKSSDINTDSDKGAHLSNGLVESKTYQVQKGDTLYSITRKFNHLSVQDLMRLNKLKDKKIRPGQRLIVG